jgi:hypothetical protein
MSLIQEALKRQQQETEGTLPDAEAPAPTPPALTPAPPEAPAAPEAPAPAPKPPPAPAPESAPAPPFRTPEATPPKPEASVAEPTEESPEPETTTTVESEPKPTRMLPTLIGIITLMVLLLGAIGWAIVYGLQFVGIRMPWQPEPPPTVAEAPATRAAPPPAPPPAPPSNPAASASAAAAPDSQPAVTDASPAAAPPSQPTETTPAAAPVTATSDQPAPAAATPPAATPQPALIWPTLKLTGIVGGGSHGAVMLNGKVVGVNETIESVRVADIEKHGVWLEYQGNRRFLKVGKTLE